MPLKIYNSLSRKKEVFTPVHPDKVSMYVCGMTVYSDAHIGHARTYLAFDIIRRYLEYKKYKVLYVQNITDVDDKIIAAAQRESIDPLEYSKRYADRCLKDLDQLGIRRADIYPKASETISYMIQMICTLIDKGYAYESHGDVYFSVDRFPEYGKLSGQQIHEMKAGTRIEPGEHKRAPLDFALWKKAKPGEPAWDSPWGKGRPGWHIECSAMSSKYLGLPFDIHGGGMDLRFPHHENEIAQAEAATGKLFARYWMHVGLLTVQGEKMSKSLGNIVNIRELLTQWDAEVIRFFFAQNHYRSPPDFTEKALDDAKKGLERMYRTIEKLKQYAQQTTAEHISNPQSSEEQQFHDAIVQFRDNFEQAMDDDFNTAKATAELFEFVNRTNRFFEMVSHPSPGLCAEAYDTIQKLGSILTLFQPQEKKSAYDQALHKKLYTLLTAFQSAENSLTVEEILTMLLEIREKARKEKDWKKADFIRSQLLELGYEIQDTSSGPNWRKT
ncbi:MAG: cysteine--tRNA ligase [Candidatus Thermoplasmatota archaeon]